jgi:hypothetical protein
VTVCSNGSGIHPPHIDIKAVLQLAQRLGTPVQASRGQEGYIVAIGIFHLFCGEPRPESSQAEMETHAFSHIALVSHLHNHRKGRRVFFIVPVRGGRKRG